jgi:signal transduction histidine kinase
MKHLDAPFFKTSIFRLTALYVIIFTFSVGILFAVVGYVARSSMHAQIAAAVQREATTLADEYDATRGSRAPELIELRLRRGALSYFLLQDANGRRISGNIAPISPEPGLRDLAVRQQLREPAAGDAEDRAEIHNAIGYGVRLSEGTFAFVASDAERITQVEKAILTAFVIGGGVSLLLAVSGGFVLGRGFLRRLEVVNRTSREIMSGRFDARIPVLHRDDELDRLAINLNATFDRVESLMESLAQISSDVAHDLRTPLSRLRQTLELARRTSTNVKEFRAGTEAAINEADDILETFSALLRISQIESGSRKAGFNRVDLSTLFETIFETYVAVAEDAGHELIAQIAPSIDISGDRELLMQLGANLVENAIRHTPAGSRIKIDLHREADGAAAVFSDRGPGIPECEYGKVFRRFYRLESSRTTPGSGLGLALVAAVADLHGARISLDDNHPGLRVTILFPYSTALPFSRSFQNYARIRQADV